MSRRCGNGYAQRASTSSPETTLLARGFERVTVLCTSSVVRSEALLNTKSERSRDRRRSVKRSLKKQSARHPWRNWSRVAVICAV